MQQRRISLTIIKSFYIQKYKKKIEREGSKQEKQKRKKKKSKQAEMVSKERDGAFKKMIQSFRRVEQRSIKEAKRYQLCATPETAIFTLCYGQSTTHASPCVSFRFISRVRRCKNQIIAHCARGSLSEIKYIYLKKTKYVYFRKEKD